MIYSTCVTISGTKEECEAELDDYDKENVTSVEAKGKESKRKRKMIKVFLIS